MRNEGCSFLADNKLTKCPMCGTPRKGSAETCSYCGYIYEDNSTPSKETSFNQSLSYSSSTDSNTVSTSVTKENVRPSSAKEAVLKRQDNVIFKNGRAVDEGVLLLTNRRLVFAPAKSAPANGDVQNTLHQPDAYAIPLEQVANVSGNRGILRPSLKVNWHEQPGDSSTTKVEFMQKSGPRTMDDVRNAISEWVPLIDQAARSELDIPELQTETPSQPAIDETELRKRVLGELNDKQWKGFFQISRDLDEKYGDSIDPDALENVCKNLVKEKLVEQDKHGEFFKKLSSSGKG
jgi:hypothetical protein